MVKSIAKRADEFNEFLRDLQAQIAEYVVRQIEEQLEAEVRAWLRRGYHVRRQKVKGNGQACCQRCGTRAVKSFSRNGHRPRQLVTMYGVLGFWLPRVVCSCGGSVTIPFTIIEPYQRWWDDVLEQINRWADLGLSLRQMQAEIGDQVHTQTGLSKLNKVVQAVNIPPLMT